MKPKLIEIIFGLSIVSLGIGLIVILLFTTNIK